MRIAALLLACASLACAQLDDNTVTVTVTRTVTLQPDQASLGITVTTPATAGLDDVLAAFPGLGLAATDLTYVSTSIQNVGPSLNWQFSKALPFAGLKDALAAVVAAEQNLAASHGAFALSFYVQGQSSQAAGQSPALCPIPTLLSNAQAQAQQMASAAGVRLGAIVSMTQGTPPAALVYDFLAVYGILAIDPTTGVPLSRAALFYAPAGAAPGCTLTVQFQLLH